MSVKVKCEVTAYRGEIGTNSSQCEMAVESCKFPKEHMVNITINNETVCVSANEIILAVERCKLKT